MTNVILRNSITTQSTKAKQAKKWISDYISTGEDENIVRRKMKLEFKTNNIIDEGRWESIFDEIFDAWFDRAFKLTRPSIVNKEAVKQRIEQTAEQITRIVKERAKIQLLEMVMPNGKTFGDCTGSDIRKLATTEGAWLRRAARLVKPRQHARNAMTEQEWQELYATSGSLNNPRKKHD